VVKAMLSEHNAQKSQNEPWWRVQAEQAVVRDDGLGFYELKAQSEYYAEIERNSDGRHGRR
jgi:hypothetical protein